MKIMDKEKFITNLAIFGGPIGWAMLGFYYTSKIGLNQYELKKEEGRKKVLMSTINITDGDQEYRLQVPQYNVKRYNGVLRHIQDRLEQYRKVYNKNRQDVIIMRMLAIDLTVMHHPIDFCEDRVHEQVSICGETIDITIKKSQVWLYKDVAKRLSDRYSSICARYGDSINEKEAMWMLLLETDSRNFIGL